MQTENPVLNQPAAPSLIFKLTSIVEPLAVADLFPKSQPLIVELGSGDGSFLVNYARVHPEHNCLGVERLVGRLRKLDRKGRRVGLTNLRGLRIESSYLVEYLLRAESVTAFHIYFPDPWPKRKQRKNRLVNAHFAEIARRALVPGGIVFLRTDDPDYFAQMVTVFAADPAFQLAESPESLTGMVTDFERDFLSRGIPTLRAAYARCG